LMCPDREGDALECLTKPQIAALNKMYEGPRNPRTREQIYPRWSKSSEAQTVSAWHQYGGTREPMRVNFWRSWVFDDPRWEPRTFDFDRDLARADETIGASGDQRNADLSALKSRDAVAIVYQGWQDPVVNPIDTIAYYEQVRARQGSQEQI